MRKPLLHIAAFVLLYLLWACGGDRAMQSALDRAEALMETHPDSALALLRPYDTIPAGSGEQRARFALLYSMALDKTNSNVDNDSLTKFAYNYYSERGHKRQAMLAAYYHGSSLLNTQRSDKAVVLIIESLEKAEQLKDTLSMARSNELLGVIKYKNYMLEEALPYILKGASLYKSVGKTKNELVALSTAGLIMDGIGCREHSIQLLDSLKQQALAIGDTILAVELSMKLIPILLKNGNSQPEMSDKEANNLESFDCIYSDDSQTLSHLALHKLYKGDLQGCDSLLSRARFAIKSEEEKAPIFSIGAERARRSGDYKVAAELSDSMQKLQSTVVRELLKRDITLAERDYMADRSERAEIKKHKATIALWLSIAVFLVLGATASFAIRIIFRKRKEQIEHQIDEIRLLSDTIRRNAISNAELAGTLFQTHYKAIDHIYDQYYKGSESIVDIKLLKQSLDSAMEKLRSEESMAAIREFVNRNCNFILDRVKEALPNVKESDLTFIALIKAGFTSRAICMLLCIKRSSCYSKRVRLEEKLEKHGISI